MLRARKTVVAGLLWTFVVGCLPMAGRQGLTPDAEKWVPDQVITHLKDGGMHFSTGEVVRGHYYLLTRDNEGWSIHLKWFSHRNDARDEENRLLRGHTNKDPAGVNIPPCKPDEVFRWGRYVFCGTPSAVARIRSILER